MRSLIARFLLKLVVPLIVGLVMIGVFRRAEGWILCGLFVAWRALALAEDWRRARLPAPDWEQRGRELLEMFRQEEELAAEDGDKSAVPADDRELAQLAYSQVEHERKAFVPARSRPTLVAETIGLLGCALLVPLAVALSTSPFYSLRRNSSWLDMTVIVAALSFYGAPHLRKLRGRINPWMWWVTPTVIAAAVIGSQLAERHAYLNPLHPEHRRLAAEKVLGLVDNITAADHVDWVVNYAEDRARLGAKAEAAGLCERALRLSPGIPKAVWLMRTLGAPVPDLADASSPDATYLLPGEVPPRARTTSLSPELANVPSCTVILVRMGDVDDNLVNYVAAVLGKELGLPTLLYERTLPLPPHTRRRGLLVGKQWDFESLFAPLQQELANKVPPAPLKFLMLTSADLYSGGANFVFNVQWEWGAIVATAQFERAGGSQELFQHRVAKQAISAVIKTFGVPPSTDRRCVTSYPRSLGELDEKGNRPLPATRADFTARLKTVNDLWQRHRAGAR